MKPIKFMVALGCLSLAVSGAGAFEGRIDGTVTRATQMDGLRYTVGKDVLRVEMTATNAPNPVDLVDRQSGTLTILFPHNRSFVHLKPTAENPSAPPGLPRMPRGLPPGVGPQPQLPGAPVIPNPATQPGVTPPNLAEIPGAPQMPVIPKLPAGMPAMPTMPMPPMMPSPLAEPMELHETGQKTNLLGFACERYEIKRPGETMEIWATDQLFAFQPYVQSQPHRFGPRMIDEQWAELVAARKLFPLFAVLRLDGGPERFRFEVRSVTPQKLKDEDTKLLQPPPDYHEVNPLPF